MTDICSPSGTTALKVFIVEIDSAVAVEKKRNLNIKRMEEERIEAGEIQYSYRTLRIEATKILDALQKAELDSLCIDNRVSKITHRLYFGRTHETDLKHFAKQVLELFQWHEFDTERAESFTLRTCP